MNETTELVPQDLHIHTTFSTDDGAIVPEQTVELVDRYRYAERMGISDHVEYVLGAKFDLYRSALESHNFYVGVEVNGWSWVMEALALEVDYYMYHCRDRAEDYRGAEKLLASGRPVIVAHPNALGTDLARVDPRCLIEINNRYVWRDGQWRELAVYCDRFRFVVGSDAHQPHWLNQNVARRVVADLGLTETLLFPVNFPAKEVVQR